MLLSRVLLGPGGPDLDFDSGNSTEGERRLTGVAGTPVFRLSCCLLYSAPIQRTDVTADLATGRAARPRFAVSCVLTDRDIPVAELAVAVEDRGFDGLWLPDHTHIPTSRRSSYPLGGDLPERYLRTVEPLVALAMAAAVTSRIRVGTGVLLACLRDPITTAKALATIDAQSGGRLVVGVGHGWNIEEIADHGVDPATRRSRTREHVLAMRELWEHDVAEFEGRFVRFGPSWSWPKPVQRPLPVLIGGMAGSKIFGQVADHGHGWIPLGGSGLASAVAGLRETVAARGRDPGALEIVPFSSGAGLTRAKLDAFQRAGATEVVMEIGVTDRSGVLAQLDHLAEMIGDRR
jgi:probable F420-dependent oxidoreductase